MPKTVKSERNSPAVTLLRHLYRSYQRIRASDAVAVSEFDLSQSEFDVIATLGNSDGLKMCELASRTLTTPPNVTRICKRLEERGLLERARNADCDREVLARLTTRGEQTFKMAYPKVVANLRHDIDQRLNRDEQKKLIQLLGQLMQADDSPSELRGP